MIKIELLLFNKRTKNKKIIYNFSEIYLNNDEDNLDIKIKCHSCGKLGVEECIGFNNHDESQIKECPSDEVCLLYTWKKSSKGAIGEFN